MPWPSRCSSSGTEPGDRIAMYMQNIPQVLVTVLAAWKCGAVVVPCNPMLRERELVKILNDSGSRVLICQDDLYADVARAALPSTDVAAHDHHLGARFPDPARGQRRAMLARRDPRAATGSRGSASRSSPQHAGKVPEPIEITGDDVAFMVYTSGTTGEPKAALNTHRNVVFATTVYERWIGLTEADTILGLAPLFHVTGLIGHVTPGPADRQPAGPLLPLRCRARRAGSRRASGDVHRVGRHRLHRAAQQRGDGRSTTCRR